MTTTLKVDRALLEAALVGYEAQITDLQAKLAEIRLELGIDGAVNRAVRNTRTANKPVKRQMSADARQRIADATRKRWADRRKAMDVPIGVSAATAGGPAMPVEVPVPPVEGGEPTAVESLPPETITDLKKKTRRGKA